MTSISEMILMNKLLPKKRTVLLADQQRAFFGSDADAEAEILSMSYHRMKTPEKGVSTFRWLPKMYCDEFFETGRLRLSTIQGFGNDAARDQMEGLFVEHIRFSDYERFQVIGLGDDVLALCTTHLPNNKHPGNDACFLINDPTAFHDLITRRLAIHFPVIRSEHGKVSYKHSRVISGKSKLKAPQHISSSSIDIAPLAKYFVKPKEFEPEQEYRFCWQVHGHTNNRFIQSSRLSTLCTRVA
jgi:hypothetical protein